MALRIPFLTVEPVVFFCMANFFLLTVSFPQLLLDNICRRKYNNATKCQAMEEGYFKDEYNNIQQQSAFWISAFTGTVTGIILITLPTVGVISDVIGRRKALFLTPATQIIQCLMLISIVGTDMKFSTGLLILAGIVPAIIGDISGLYVFASSYISAITKVEERTFRITLLDAAALIASATATLSSGFIIERFGYVGVYVTVIVLGILAILDLIFFIQPDDDKQEGGGSQRNVDTENDCNSPSDHADSRPDLHEKEMQPVNQERVRELGNPEKVEKPQSKEIFAMVVKEGNKKEKDANVNRDIPMEANSDVIVAEKVYKTCSKSRLTKANSKEEQPDKWFKMKIILKHLNPINSFKIMFYALKSLKHAKLGVTLILVMGLATIGYFGESSIVILYLKNDPLYFTARQVGYFLAFESALIAILGFLVFNWVLQKVFKLNDLTMLLITSLACIPYQILLGFASSTEMLYSIQILHSVCSLNTPTIRSVLSKMAKESSVGAIMGSVAMVETLAVMIAGLAIPMAYAGLLEVYRGAPFFLLSGIMLLTTGIILICAYVSPKDIYQDFDDSV